MNTFHTYVLYSKQADRFYIGSTNNISRRIWQHNTGLSRSTKYLNDWTLVFEKVASSRSEAIKLEKYLKSWKDKQMLRELAKSDLESGVGS